MEKEFTFNTRLSKEEVIEKLKVNTLHTESIIRPQLFFGEELFFGQVTDERIRIGKNRFGNGSYPIFEIVLIENNGLTDVIVTSDTEEKNNLGKVMIISLTIIFSFLSFILGTVFFLKNPEKFSFKGVVLLSFILFVWGGLMVLFNTKSHQTYYKEDLELIVTMLTRNSGLILRKN